MMGAVQNADGCLYAGLSFNAVQVNKESLK